MGFCRPVPRHAYRSHRSCPAHSDAHDIHAPPSITLEEPQAPPIRTIGLQDIYNFFNWDNILKHPFAVIAMAVLVVLWVVISINICMREQRGECCADFYVPLEDEIKPRGLHFPLVTFFSKIRYIS